MNLREVPPSNLPKVANLREVPTNTSTILFRNALRSASYPRSFGSSTIEYQ